ncbi:acetylserotonin O-methyltransferase [Hyalangium versicolor]|uniref:acetylserotonin O-methyltransferase n=1 Tax=Hyalangium versicolor TaxID=2861190 RepID=UPI001CCD48DD|nr:acetylserotonin O-methyltransferase [Hyalangium versicolor]
MADSPTGAPPADPAVLRNMIFGFWSLRAIYVAAELGVADHLASGPRDSEELAKACQTDASALYRVLRALASVGLLSEPEPRHFALTPLGQFLRSDTPGSMRALARMLGSHWHWRTFEGILESVRTGEPAMAKMVGQPLYTYLGQNPEQEKIFDHSMTSFSSVENDAIRDAWAFLTSGTLVDVGGGRGHLLATLLNAHPGLRGILFDRPSVVANEQDAVNAHGLDARCERVGGDFFESVPSGADAYLLKYILHNWNDERTGAILRNCRRAMKPSARLLLVEQVVQPGNSPDPAKLLDLEMLVLVGGRERTEEEFRGLLADSGFSLVRVVPTRRALSIVEASPV